MNSKYALTITINNMQQYHKTRLKNNNEVNKAMCSAAESLKR